ncbi:hypothetical protein VTO42DRAFT_5730 [Malbranchea cinnamomea]
MFRVGCHRRPLALGNDYRDVDCRRDRTECRGLATLSGTWYDDDALQDKSRRCTWLLGGCRAIVDPTNLFWRAWASEKRATSRQMCAPF